MANSKPDEAEIWLNVVVCVVLWYLCNYVMLSVHYCLLTMTHQSKTGNLDWSILCYLEYRKNEAYGTKNLTLGNIFCVI